MARRHRAKAIRQNKSPAEARPFPYENLCLDVKRGAATAGALHVGILKLESSAFEGLHVIDYAALQIHKRSGIDEYFEVVEIKALVHHAGAVLERHGIGEAGASTADHTHAQPGGNRILLRHNFLYLGDSNRRK